MEPTLETLPAVVPDLAVAEYAGGRWRILSLSTELESLVGGAEGRGQERDFKDLFGSTVPSLPELALEVAQREEPLEGIRVRFPEAGLTFLVRIRPGGLTGDFRGRVVHFYFRPLPRETQPGRPFYGMIGRSAAITEVFRKISIYAPSEAAVVVTGETGSGKELVARALHLAGARSSGPFVAVNCTAISDELLESELFGHEKGAFTGALRTHKGRFERADGGTLFLDEIGDMPLHTQAKLLRVLEEKKVERVGAEQPRSVDVRVVCATNVPLEQAVGQGRFRADLYHRLSVLRIHLSPLRERTEDIPLLVEYFLGEFNRRYARRIERLTNEALSLLQSYLWPGNLRELRNVLERVYIETQGEVIGARAFAEWVRERQDFSVQGALPQTAALVLSPPYPLESMKRLPASEAQHLDSEVRLVGHAQPPQKRSTLPAQLDEGEIRSAWSAARGNLSAAARLLGVHRATLYRYLEKLGLSRDDLVD